MTSRTRRGAGGSVLTIPNTLPVSGSLEIGSAKRPKREHEVGVYATMRNHRGAESIEVLDLRDGWRHLLLPKRGSVHTEGGEGTVLAAEAVMPDVLPLYLAACYGSEASQQLLTRELAATIAEADWQELWVLLGQISTCIEQLATPNAARPWWVRQAQPAGCSGDVAEYVDLAAREAQGGADAPLDVELAGEPVPPRSEGTVKQDEMPPLQAPVTEAATATEVAVPGMGQVQVAAIDGTRRNNDEQQTSARQQGADQRRSTRLLNSRQRSTTVQQEAEQRAQ